MKKKWLVFLLLLLFSRSVYSACIFMEDFSSPAIKGKMERLEISGGRLVLKRGNLVTNGSFEDSEKAPVGFFIYDSRCGSIDTHVAYAGKNSVRLDRHTSLYLHPVNFVATREGIDWYVVSVWVKTEFLTEFPEENMVQLRVWGKDQKKENHTQVTAARVAGTHDWVRLVQPVLLKKETAFVSCDVQLQTGDADQTNCKVWIDGVQIEEGKSPTAFTEKYYREGFYTSPVICLKKTQGKIHYQAELLPETSVQLRWRTGKDYDGLEESDWSQWSRDESVSFSSPGQLLQLQVRLVSEGRGLVSPALVWLKVEQEE